MKVSQLRQIIREEILRELDIQKKELYGKGSIHRVYPLKNHPDKVIKIADDPISWKYTQEELEIFKQHPDIFPKVYKVTDKYAIIEKLDDKGALNDNDKTIQYIKGYIDNSNELVKELLYSEDIPGTFYSYLLYKVPSFNEEYNELYQALPNEYQILLEKWYKIISKIISKLKEADIHARQFAYDKSGNLKLIDF